jgi:hypothetical protein
MKRLDDPETVSTTVAEPTTTKRGRPRKHPEKKVKGKRGRPPGPARLREDPDRFVVAYLIARWMLTPTISRLELARDIAQLDACDVNSRAGAEVFANALAEGRKVRLQAKSGTRTAAGDPDEARWRYQDWANAEGERLWRKADRLTKLPYLSDSPHASAENDAGWLSRMVDAWCVLFEVSHGKLPALSLDAARELAAKAEEAKYFDQKMMQYLRAAFRVAPPFFAI